MIATIAAALTVTTVAFAFDEEGAILAARTYATALYVTEHCPTWTIDETFADGMFAAFGYTVDRIDDDVRTLRASREQYATLTAAAPADGAARRERACELGRFFAPDAPQGLGVPGLLMPR